MTADQVSPREFDMLRQQVAALAVVPGLAVQVGEVIKDVAQIQTELAEHQKSHERELKARQSTRRWAWTFAVTGFAAVQAPLIYLLSHLH